MNGLKAIEFRISPLREKLRIHPLYSALGDIEDIQIFMERHVFAVWDFMSLLKFLQIELTHTTLPWMPGKNAVLARFINEIVHGEESDENELGEPKSHYEMYIDAIKQIGASTENIDLFLNKISTGVGIESSLNSLNVEVAIKNFITHTFDLIASKKTHLVAASFTYGREDVIPDMFIEIIKNAEVRDQKANYSKLTYYLERHIEIDGGEHGPLSLRMIEELCGNDPIKWKEAEDIAVLSLERRIELWDGIYNALIYSKSNKNAIIA
jgi:hypothetical protein|tara:strand:- start:394 stop:1194 length:801 start_codon:yes stop_codon:yes gene_type:complete